MKRVYTASGSLYVGPLPSYNELMICGPFDIIWNLSSELEKCVEAEEKYARVVLRGYIQDMWIPQDIYRFVYQLELIVDCLRHGGNVFVHCLGGCGRTGMGLACIKSYLENCSAQEALDFANQEIGGPELKMQRRFVKRFIKGRKS
jgi:protein-tyrosine phosphatase